MIWIIIQGQTPGQVLYVQGGVPGDTYTNPQTGQSQGHVVIIQGGQAPTQPQPQQPQPYTTVTHKS